MLERLFIYLLSLGVASFLGFELSGWRGAAAGVALMALLFQLLDIVSAARVLNWVRQNVELDLGEPPRVFGAWREVADRVRRRRRLADRRLAQSRTELGAFLDAIQASPNGVMLLDAQGRIEWMNEAACAHFGLSAEADQHQHVGNLVRDPAFADYFHAQMKPEVKTAGPGITLQRWGQAAAVLKVQLHPYGDGQRLLLSQDFTAMAKAEAMQRDFVANVSHEIRTPLTVLSGFIETLQTLQLDEAERARYLDLMAKQAARQQALINDLLTLSKLEGRARPGTDEQFAVSDIAAEYQADADALSGQLYADAPPQQLDFAGGVGLHIVGSRSEWQSACTNLVHNAIRYSGAGGRVSASWVLLPDGQAEFAVQDTGPGIAPEHIARLAERFYRVDTSRSRDSGGTGLGLAITRQVAQRHGGELLITSTLGKGARFALRVPAARVRLGA
jgi:two-component system phosphate regulon sensor histidine kinase PhoR